MRSLKDSTTDLAKVRKNPLNFTWGLVRKIHDIGDYTFIEYLDSDDAVSFHVYVKGLSTNQSVGSLDKAFLFAIAHAQLGFGSNASYMALACSKLLNLI